ncbi:MAG: glycosyltransferase family 2 protein [Prolixibacteraceae bacterium]
MAFADRYLAKQNSTFSLSPIEEWDAVELIVVIPSYNEPDLSTTLKSLFTCNPTSRKVGVLVVVNDSEKSAPEVLEQNRKTLMEIELMEAEAPQWIQLSHIYAQQLPHKHAGVGWARKIGMDLALTHFNQHDQSSGIIVSFDADSTVAPNYFQAIQQYFIENPESIATTIYFEHPLTEDETSDAISWYELDMRYYKHALHYTGFSTPIYSVGSSLAVKASAYVAQGGMNRKKAGEDFYFLHKMLPYGTIGSLNTTTVFPSARLSNRVPFGTGAALTKDNNGEIDLTLCFPLTAFNELRLCFAHIDQYYINGAHLKVENLSANLVFQTFCLNNSIVTQIGELANNCSSIEVFRKRFFHVFSAFIILKWLNYAQLNGYAKCSLLAQSYELAKLRGFAPKNVPEHPKLMLKLYRDVDKLPEMTRFAT